MHSKKLADHGSVISRDTSTNLDSESYVNNKIRAKKIYDNVSILARKQISDNLKIIQ